MQSVKHRYMGPLHHKMPLDSERNNTVTLEVISSLPNPNEEKATRPTSNTEVCVLCVVMM